MYGLVTAGTTVAGGLWVTSRPRAWLTQARLSMMMAIGAGLLLAVACFELMPEGVLHAGTERAFPAMFAGVVAVLLFERYLAPRLGALFPADAGAHDAACSHAHGHGHHHHDEPSLDHHHAHDAACGHAHAPLLSHSAACSALGCLLVCTFFDGIALASGFSVSPQVGIILAIGLTLHMLPEGVLASSVVLASSQSKVLARRAAVAAGVSFLLGIVAAFGLGAFLTLALPFACGVLLYVTLGQLVPVALRAPRGIGYMALGAAFFLTVIHFFPHSHAGAAPHEHPHADHAHGEAL